MSLNPLPFRLHPTGRDTIGLEGIASVSYRLSGFLRLADQGVALEWTGTRTTEQVSLDRIGTDLDELPLERFELPFGRIAGAWVIGGWWRPRFELRAWGSADLNGVPSTRGVTLPLRIHRRDRSLARAVALEITERVAVAELALEHRLRLGEAGAE